MPKKDENVKKVTKFYMPWNFEKEQAWLEEQAREGWKLVKHGFHYTFEKSAPEEVVIRSDYISLATDKKKQEYISLFEESGWEFIGATTGWYYFRIPADQYDTDIYSDPQSRIEQLKRLNQDALGVFFLYFILFAVVMDYETWFDLIVFIPMLAMFIWGFIYMLKIRDKIKALYEELGEEEPPIEIEL